MDDSLSIIFAVLVALIIMFIVPLIDTWELQDNLAYVVTYAAVTDFVDTVRNTGYISVANYDAFLTTLNSTGNTYSVSMEHRAFNTEISSAMLVPGSDGIVRYGSAYLNTYTRTILDSIMSGTVYKLNKYDYFYVTVKNTNKTQASIITNMFAHDNSNFKIGCAYGGIVWAIRDE